MLYIDTGKQIECHSCWWLQRFDVDKKGVILKKIRFGKMLS